MYIDLEKMKESRGDEIANLYNLAQKDELEYIFRGVFTPEVVKIILDLAKVTLENLSDVSKIKNKVYYIAGESIQNIARHNSEEYTKSRDKFSLFAIHKKQSKFYITTGNVLKTDAVQPLKNKIEKINSIEQNDLRSYSRTMRTSQALSKKGGAGLGLIEMAKRSGNKLDYDFYEINNDYSYFYLNTEIPIIKDETNKQKDKYSMINVKELHDILIKKNVIMFFKGTFNQESLLNLLSIVENQLRESTVSIKIYNLMVEMLQNISKHADDYSNGKDWKSGIFLITESDKEYALISGNYVLNSKINLFEKSIKNVNKLSYNELIIEYNKILQGFYTENNKQGLGLLDIRRKSKTNLICNFYPVDKKISFFTLQVIVKKQTK